MAAYPNDLIFGVVDQSPEDFYEYPITNVAPGQIRYMKFKPEDSKGACWARALAMTLYNGEEWFLQLDSHMDFDQDWDKHLIDHANLIDFDKNPGVISSYPPGFRFNGEGDEVIKDSFIKACLFNGLVNGTEFKENFPGLQFVAQCVVTDTAVKGYHIGAGCIFGKGEFVKQFPYDPEFYFIGEEQSLSIRLYTKGWDIYHIPELAIYHLYNFDGSGRILHWDQKLDKERSVKWYAMEETSRQRFRDLVWSDKNLGIYGLGKSRTLEQFAQWCGIDYTNRCIRPTCELDALLKK